MDIWWDFNHFLTIVTFRIFSQHFGWSKTEGERTSFPWPVPDQGYFSVSLTFIFNQPNVYLLLLAWIWLIIKLILYMNQGIMLELDFNSCHLHRVLWSNSNFCLSFSRYLVFSWEIFCSFGFLIGFSFPIQLSLLLKGTVVAPPDKFGNPLDVPNHIVCM